MKRWFPYFKPRAVAAGRELEARRALSAPEGRNTTTTGAIHNDDRRKQMKRSFPYFKPLAVAAATLMLCGAAHARDLTIASWGGAYQDAQRTVIFTPFAEAEGVKFLEDTYLGGYAQFQAMLDTGLIPWDVVQLETAELTRGCEEGVFVSLDYSKIDKSKFVPGFATECGVGTVTFSVLIGYNTEKVTTEPTKLTDFWDTSRWPGKRGMRKGPKLNLELALMADGVAPKDVYKVLNTPAGVDRAFAKLDQIKPHVQWWESGAQAPDWLMAGDVELSIAYNGRIDTAKKEGLPLEMIWDGTVYGADRWAILKGGEHVDVAYKFVKFATDPQRQADFTKFFPYGPTTVEGQKLVPSDRSGSLPIGANLATGLQSDSPEGLDFWVDFLEELTERWNTWAAQN